MKKHPFASRLSALAVVACSFTGGAQVRAAPLSAASPQKMDSRQKWPALWSEMFAQISAMPAATDVTSPDLPPRLKSLIESSQPQSGDILLEISREPQNPLYRKAIKAFVRSWNTMTPAQIEAYFQSTLGFTASTRESYPQDAEAGIRLEYDIAPGQSSWNSWPLEETGFKSEDFKTWTTISLDGQPRDKPFSYYGPGATVGWIMTQKLGVGTHTISMTLRYEYLLRGEKHSGQVASPLFSFEIVPPEENDLAVPSSRELDALVVSDLQFAETEAVFDAPWRRRFLAENTNSEAWSDNKTYSDNSGTFGFHLPSFNLAKPLPVDLCFEVTMKVEGRRESYPAGQLLILRGDTSCTHFDLRQESFFLLNRKGRSGLVPVRFVLQPSRSIALTNPKVTGYYPRVITTGVMRLKLSRH